MKNKNEVTGNLLLGCTVLRITPEFPGAVTIFLLEHAASMPEDLCYSLVQCLYSRRRASGRSRIRLRIEQIKWTYSIDDLHTA